MESDKVEVSTLSVWEVKVKLIVVTITISCIAKGRKNKNATSGNILKIKKIRSKRCKKTKYAIYKDLKAKKCNGLYVANPLQTLQFVVIVPFF